MDSNEILIRCVAGVGGSLHRPFFHRHIDETIEPSKTPFQHSSKGPTLLKEAMQFFDENTELYVKDWTILSERDKNSLVEAYTERGQTLVVPIAHTYAGMGNVQILAYCPLLDICFTYMDGGSNGYDRSDRFEAVINYTEQDIRARECALTILWE